MATRTSSHRIHAPEAIETAELRIDRVRMTEMRKVAQLQKEAFGPRLAYGLATLIILSVTPSVRFLVARKGSNIVGCAIGDRLGSQSRVVNICVSPDHRREGIATRLLADLEQELPTGNMTLMVQAENTGARALYQQLGYRETGFNKDYYGKGRDGYWMSKTRPTPRQNETSG